MAIPLIGIAALSSAFLLCKIIYYVYLHPLSKYPGPKIFAATSLINTWYTNNGTRAYKVSALHNKYGPIIRIGPNELSYVTEQAWKDVYGSHKSSGGTELRKYLRTSRISELTIVGNPSDEAHSKIRKALALGFSPTEIRARENIIQTHVTLLMERLTEKAGEEINILWWLGCMSADINSTMTFGISFNALKTSTLPQVVGQAERALKIFTMALTWDKYWLTKQLRQLSNTYQASKRTTDDGQFFKKLVGERLKTRAILQAQKKGGDVQPKDFISHMSQNVGTPKGLSLAEIGGVSADLMIAGSDTVATASTGLLYHLLTNPSKLQILTNEIRTTFSSETDITLTTVNGLKYQNAAISESMRLFPAGPEGTRRITGPNGNIICGDLIPAGTFVGVYHWAAGHNTSSWLDTESFIPERWLGDPKYEDDIRGIINPFSYGPRGCLGQNLALAVMRFTTAKLLWNFDFQICDISKTWMDMSAWTVTYEKRPLMVRLKIRDL